MDAYLRDMEDLLIDCIQNDKDVHKVISSSEGDEQTWRGMGISKEEIDKFQKFVDKMKKKIGKDIDTKKDNQDFQLDMDFLLPQYRDWDYKKAYQFVIENVIEKLP